MKDWGRRGMGSKNNVVVSEAFWVLIEYLFCIYKHSHSRPLNLFWIINSGEHHRHCPPSLFSFAPSPTSFPLPLFPTLPLPRLPPFPSTVQPPSTAPQIPPSHSNHPNHLILLFPFLSLSLLSIPLQPLSPSPSNPSPSSPFNIIWHSQTSSKCPNHSEPSHKSFLKYNVCMWTNILFVLSLS